ncbi:alcohol dehydrogenase catalytic domain-containing protein [Pontivivens ytuae]|uniref:Alcohol dehydrogenase catalytic domain-containing protein n=1 Tax=Pontivivens ytuae TaxID=2789856 RepID=A0A7S9LRV8_9RHOB|nr:alcohol dehydrogenase catalytic domain-containing protein [Pontivivens ytuae]QPH54118.1 alcohol dehydrogenase catalytic domain-containing protein [Pontivivens ytuae]
MKALVYTGPNTLQLREVPPPQAPSVEVAFCGICGSDMHAWAGHDDRRPAPLVLGHEIAGTYQGRRVTVNPLVTCGVCTYCRSGRDNLCPDRQILSMPPRPGGFAEAVAVPERNLIDVPDDVSLEAAALAEPLACGWHAVRLAGRLLDLGRAECLVLGGGAIGAGAALALHAHGAGRIMLVEPHAERRARLADLPAKLSDAAVEADLVIDGVGIDATRAAAFAHVRPGGVIAHIGLGGGTGGFDPRRATLQEITFFGTYTYTAADFAATAAAIFDGRLPVEGLYEVRALDDGAQAFTDLAERRVATPKVLLRP